MYLTQKEAKLWSEILKGFSEGKRYQIPMVYDYDGTVIQYDEITDYSVKQYPTITMMHRGMSMIDVRTITEVVYDERRT